MNPMTQPRTTTLPVIIAVALGCFALSPAVQAVSPTPDGNYGPPTYGAGNTAEGQDALFSLSTGTYNTGVGWVSLWTNRAGNFNTAIGAGTLFRNTADQNTATGATALFYNTSGLQNTAIGASALQNNTTGSVNTAVGYQALFSNNTGTFNTAVGCQALSNNSSGMFFSGAENTATGYQVLFHNTAGVRNTGVGAFALLTNTTGNQNTAIGDFALYANTGGANIALGDSSGLYLTTGNGNIDIGNLGVAGESSTIRIGSTPQFGPQPRTFIAGIRGVTTGFPNAVNVLIDSAGQLGTMSSSRRFKHDIQPIAQASEALLSLKPVRFHHKSDQTKTPQFGLIAEEVAEVNPDLVVRDQNGEIYSVRYDAVNAMLLNEFLKEHQTVQELKASVAQQKKQIEALTAVVQKVSAQLELSKSAPQTVLNSQ